MTNHYAEYRMEVHACENGQWFSQLWRAEMTKGLPVWESRYYDDLEEASDAAKYEWDQRAEQDREAAAIARLGPDDRPGEWERD